MKKLLSTTAMFAIALSAMAQSGTNSPYSQFGYGKLSEQSQGFNRGMNGVGLAFREHNQVNYLNPASYSAIDSLTFIFDVGMSLQMTNFKENGKSKNANNADFEYAVGSFRLVKNVGMSCGILPFTNVGYSFSASSTVPGYSMAPSASTGTTYTQNYSGNGGLRQFFIGAGWQTPLKGLSVGMNASYLWGTVSNYITNTYSDNNVKSLAKQYSISARSYKLDFGVQYSHWLNSKDIATVGVTLTPGHSLNADPECLVITSNSQSAVNDTTKLAATDGCSLPTQLGIGFSYKHANQWLVGLDYTLQTWSSVKFPVYGETNGTTTYTSQTDVFSNRHKINMGGEYCRNENGRNLGDKIHYRFGMGYTTPYLRPNGNEGPKEFSVSAGVGIPIINSWNNRSMLNIGFQWQNMSGNNLLTENTFLINIGMTFNERWFAKWRFE